MTHDPLTLAIVGHLVGDYLLQNDWMAQNKKARIWPCVVHCTLWTVAVMFLANWWVWWVPLVLFGTHFIQDHTTIVAKWMRMIGQGKNFMQPPLAPWSFIVVDNVWHILTLAAIAEWVPR